MTRKNSILLFLFCTLGMTIHAQNVTLGVQTGDASTNVLLATSTTAAANYSRSAAIYTAAEIIAAGGHAGYINKLWWHKLGTGEYTTANATLKVYFKHVSQTIHAGNITWATDTIGSVPVFSSTTYSIPTGTGWKQLTLNKPFIWNGTDNIEVFVDWFRASTPAVAISWARSTGTNTNAATTSAAATPGAPASLTRNANRPLLQLEIIDSTASDAALIRMETPKESINAGLDSVCVKLRNWGGLAIDSVDIDWEVDGVLQPTVARKFTPSLKPTDSSAVIKLGNYTFTTGYHTIRIWTKNPNGVTDADRRNDTITKTIWVRYPTFAGTYTINPALPETGTNFKTFSNAARAISEAGISSTVYFDVPANAVFNENNILLTATGTATDSIVFRKSGTGNNPVIVSAPGLSSTRDFIIGLEGSDYIVFDRINLRDVTSTTSTTDQMEWGFAFFVKNATDGSRYNTIRNCRIDMPSAIRTSGGNVGIYSNSQTAAGTAVTVTSITGANSFNKFFNDSMVSCMMGVSLIGSDDSAYYDDQNRIGVDGQNVIINMTPSSSNTKGIFVNYQDNIKIANNIINTGNLASGSAMGIHTSTGLNSNVDIYNNTITIRPVSGTPLAINNQMGKNGVNNTININHNTIKDCYLGGGTNEFILLGNDAAAINVNIHHNILENDSSNSTGSFYGMDNGFSSQGSPVCTSNIYANTIRNLKRVSTGTGLSGGIYNAPLIVGCVTNIYDNNISQLNSYGGSAGTQAMNGILFSGASTINVYRNTIHSITSPSATGRSSGITFFSSSGTGLSAYIYNNYIYNLTAPNSNMPDASIGLYLNPVGGADKCFAGAYYNTIYLSDTASPSSTSSGSSGIYASSALPLSLINNIVINQSVPAAAGGIVAAYKRSSAVLASYSDSSNNNILYTGSFGNRRYIYYDGVDSALTVGAFRGKMGTRDQSSLGSLPKFINTTTLPYNLRIDPAVVTPVEGAGRPISLPVAVSTDFDNDSRSATTPDIGADEGNFIPGDFEAPAISYTKLKNTSSTANRTLNITISDASGVDGSVNGKPLLYYRKGFGGFITAPALSQTGNSYSFVIDHATLGGVTIGDVIEYYIAAQDLSPLVNVATSPDGGLGANPPGNIAPIPATYRILAPLTGTHYVGRTPHTPAATYTTLTDAFNDYNSKGMSGAVEFILIDTLYTTSTGETLPLTISENPDATSVRTLTVKPETGVKAVITGVSPIKSSVLKLNGSDYVIINGINANNTSLSISNKAISPNADTLNVVVWISTAGPDNGANNNVIRNCAIQGISTKSTTVAVYSGTAIGTGFGQAVETNNNNNLIDSNYISKAQFGVIFMGSSAVNPSIGNKVSNNRLGTAMAGDGFYQQAIVMNRQNNGEVYRNDIQNLFSDATTFSDIYGVNMLNSRNTIVHANKIHNLKYTGTTYSYVIGISSTALAYKTAGNPSNNRIYNNAIYGLSSVSTNFTFNTAGINLADGYGDKVYYNTVSLTDQLSNGNGPSAAFSNGYGSIPGNSPTYGNNIDVRNNVFYVTGSAGTTGSKKLYAHYSKAPNASGSILNNNFLYVNVASPAVGFTGGLSDGTDYATLAAWQTATGMEANSSAADPLLNTNSILIPQNASPVIGAGTPISGITADINGVPRHPIFPAAGAYETKGDFRGPDIAFTPLKNTTLLTNLNATNFAAITDASGVNSTVTTRPRFYYKKSGDLNTYNGNTAANNGWKWVEASNGSSPFSFVIDYALLQSSAVTIGDTIQYFMVAQDNNASVNVGSSAQLFNMPLSINLDASHFPASGFNSYRVIPGAQGNIYVGSGQQYPNLTDSAGLFSALKDQLILTGDLTVLVTSNLTENGTNDLVNWQEEGLGGYRVLIRPDQPVKRSISGNVANALIRMNGTRRVVFDGADVVTGTGRYLTIINQNTSNPVFSFINDARFDTIRNCMIEGANTSSLSGLVFIGTSTGGGNSFNQVSQNIISHSGAARFNTGIYSGGSTLSKNNSNNLSGNLIRNFSGSGIYISSNNGDGWIINNNHICDSFGSAATTDQIGIEFLAISKGNTINANHIGGRTWFAADSSWVNSGNNAFTGITASFDNVNGSNAMNMNVVKNITRTNTGTSAVFTGIRIARGNVVATNNLVGDSIDAAKGIYTSGANTTTGIEITNGFVFSSTVVQNNRVSNLISLGTTLGNRLRGISYTNTSNNSSIPVTISGNRISHLSSYSNATGLAAGEQAVTGIYINPYSSTTAYGPVSINNNSVSDIKAYSLADTVTVPTGIFLNNASGSVNGNMVYNIRNYSSRNSTINPAIAAGILFRETNQLLLSNNMIVGGVDTIDNIEYIGIWNPYTGAGAGLYHNSIAIKGSNYTSVPSYAFFRGNNNNTDLINTPVSGNNNIFFSDRISSNGYAIGNNSNATANGFGVQGWNNNAYYNYVDANKTGIWNGMPGNLATFKVNSQKDSASVYTSVEFSNAYAGDLHLITSSLGNLTLAGVRVSIILKDFDNETRNSTPYIGADENTAVPVPVKLTAFNANHIKQDVLISWITASERNVSHFTVEASTDGKRFEPVGEITARGNTSSANSYAFTHLNAQQAMNGATVIYYRLTSTDRDGSSEQSNLVKVMFDTEQQVLNSVVVFPNPFNTAVTLTIPATETTLAELVLTDLQGRIVASQSYMLTAGSNQVLLNKLDELRQGVYFIKVNAANESKVIKVIKQ